MSTIDLSLLPAPSIVEVLSFEDIYAERKTALVSHFPVSQQDDVARALEIESEPMAKILQENAYRELVWRQRVNEGARAVMLAFATGTDLDQLAANVNLTRLVAVQVNGDTTITTVETDALLRERIQLAYEGLSVAGPRNAYVKHARDADARVADVAATSPEPCEVVVTVLSTEGDGAATGELLDVVRDALSDEDVRPLGDRLTVQTGSVSGTVSDSVRVTALVDLGVKDLNRRTVIVPLRAGQSLLALPGGATQLDLTLKDVWVAQTLARELQSQFPYKIESWQESNAQLVSALNAQSISTSIIRGVVLAVVVLGIASVLVVSVVQKGREIGILRAMGATRGQVLRVFLVQGAVVGALGSVLGLLLAVALIWVFTHFVRGSDGLPLFSIALPLPMALQIALIASVCGVLAAVAPARRAAALDPAQAIRM